MLGPLMGSLGKLLFRVGAVIGIVLVGVLAIRWILSDVGSDARPWVCSHTPAFHHALCETP